MHQAKRNKKDEFYTQLSDIENELRHYTDHFKNKVVYCNCDDPRVSNFFVYFSERFEVLGLKMLITTCYKSQTPSLFSQHDSEKAVYLEYKGDQNKNKIVDDSEVDVLPLQGDGDFRSEECIAILKKADIVVTNPPFSLFREYVKQLMEYNKKFLIIGHQSTISNRDIFPHFQENRIWLGYGFSGGAGHFHTNYEDYATASNHKEGMVRVSGVHWFTNLEHKKRNEKIEPFQKYSEEKNPKYDNYDAIEVSKTRDIPCDYEGVMGVPITFLDKYNPDEFEILGCTQRGCHDKVPDTKKYNDYWEVRPDGTRTGSSGNKTNENPNLLGNDGVKNFFTNGKRSVQSKYSRIFIKNRNPKRNENN